MGWVAVDSPGARPPLQKPGTTQSGAAAIRCGNGSAPFLGSANDQKVPTRPVPALDMTPPNGFAAGSSTRACAKNWKPSALDDAGSAHANVALPFTSGVKLSQSVLT